MIIYKLVSEDLTHLGGPMGSEYTTTNFTKVFSTLEKAKDFAQKDYGREPIKWKKSESDSRKNVTTSGDMGFVMYDIFKEEMD